MEAFWQLVETATIMVAGLAIRLCALGGLHAPVRCAHLRGSDDAFELRWVGFAHCAPRA